MLFDYRSSRPLADLAEGLIAGCVDHYGERVRIETHAAGRRRRRHRGPLPT